MRRAEGSGAAEAQSALVAAAAAGPAPVVSLIPGRGAAQLATGWASASSPGAAVIEGFPLAGVARPRGVPLQPGGVASASRPATAARPASSRLFAPRLLRGGELPPLSLAGPAASSASASPWVSDSPLQRLGMALGSSFLS